MVDAGGGCIGWGARDRDLMRGTVGTSFMVRTRRDIQPEEVLDIPVDPQLPVQNPPITRPRGRPVEFTTRTQQFEDSTRRLPSQFERVK